MTPDKSHWRRRGIHRRRKRQGLLSIQLIDHLRGCKTSPAFHQPGSCCDRIKAGAAHQKAQGTSEETEKQEQQDEQEEEGQQAMRIQATLLKDVLICILTIIILIITHSTLLKSAQGLLVEVADSHQVDINSISD